MQQRKINSKKCKAKHNKIAIGCYVSLPVQGDAGWGCIWFVITIKQKKKRPISLFLPITLNIIFFLQISLTETGRY